MAPDKRLRPSARWRPWLLGLALWLALAAVAAGALWHLRRDDVNGQRRELALLSFTLTGQVDRTLSGVHRSLDALRSEVREGLLATPAGQTLRTHARLMSRVQALWLLDRDGRVVAASDGSPPPSPADFIPALQTLARNAVSLSKPFLAADAQEMRVAMAMPLQPSPEGREGWVVAALPASALLGKFALAPPGIDARMSVQRSDGTLLAGDTGLPPNAAAQLLTSRHEVASYGVAIEVSRDMAKVLSSWRETADLVGVALALVLLTMATAMGFVQRAERRRHEAQSALQAQLARASRLESLGTLAGGVAHDFNNVLAGIVGYGEMAQDAAPPGSDQARHLDRLMQAALRGKALVERVLAFSRGGARQSVVFEFAPVIEEVLALLSASLRPGVVLEHGLDAPGACLRGDPTQAFEAVMNLCTNAMQAMPAGGMLSVQLQRTHVTQARVLSHSLLAAGDHLALTVSDQGGGITPDVMEHLFEPFFTTRGSQSGTGLGLAVVHGVVAEFGGAIDVQSSPGQGARFTLYFPECTDAVGGTELPDEEVPTGAGQALLVVDDDPTLAALADELLRGLGYDPVISTDPVAALDLLRDHPQRFAALMTDEVMPGLTGTALTQKVRSLVPELPVLLVSGYGGALLARRAAAAGVDRVLTKPLRRAELARALAELLR